MYSLALIIFVVSEKAAFEHFPIGSNVNLVSKRFFSETTWTIETKLPRNDHWKVLYKIYVFYVDRKSKMAATAIHRLTLDPMGKCSNAAFSETTNIIKAKLYMNGSHLGFPIDIKNIDFVEDLPMIIPGQFGFNCPSGFREEAF
jgi:hypothetical protein